MSREAAVTALATSIAAAYPWASGPVRRLKLWSDVPGVNRPAAFLFEGGAESYEWSQGAAPKRAIEVKLFAYLDARDPATLGASLLNGVMDALDAALVPQGADVPRGRNTLSGAAYLCRIEGKPLKDPGDLDGDALLIVPIRIVLP